MYDIWTSNGVLHTVFGFTCLAEVPGAQTQIEGSGSMNNMMDVIRGNP